MPRLQSANSAGTTLASSITNTDITITVDNGAGFPNVPFRVTIENESENMEIVEVSAKNGNSWTVERGMEGTANVSHNAGVSVKNDFTAGTYEELAGKDLTGDLSNLTTTNKTDLVSAVNEVDSNADSNSNKIGVLSSLNTTDKSNLVAATNSHLADTSAHDGFVGSYKNAPAFTDFNDLTIPGFYEDVYTDPKTNEPIQDVGARRITIAVRTFGNNEIHQQINYLVFGSYNGAVYHREYDNGGWKPWEGLVRISDYEVDKANLLVKGKGETIQSGIATVTYLDSNLLTASVTFDSSFATSPHVITSLSYEGGDIVPGQIKDVYHQGETVSGFDIRVTAESTVSFASGDIAHVHWIAVG